MSEYIYASFGELLANIDGDTSLAREEIVRCWNCMNYATDELGDYCALLDFEDVKSMANGFCAWGIRKKEKC